MATTTRIVRATRGTTLTCKGSPQEAAPRMLTNKMDPDVVERPDKPIVHGGTGKAARQVEVLDAIVRPLTGLGHEEALVQSGEPVRVFRTCPGSARVLVVNSRLVGLGRLGDLRALEPKGLTMFGQMTAESRIHIGSRGSGQRTYEARAKVARHHFTESRPGQALVTARLVGTGRVQPLGCRHERRRRARMRSPRPIVTTAPPNA